MNHKSKTSLHFEMIFLFLVLLVMISGCEAKKDNERDLIISAIVNSKISGNTRDCVYCSDKQVFGGTCSCYSNIPVGACPGNNSGEFKNNSYKISCSSLTKSGIWTADHGGVSSCSAQSCPPEAYQAALGKE